MISTNRGDGRVEKIIQTPVKIMRAQAVVRRCYFKQRPLCGK